MRALELCGSGSMTTYYLYVNQLNLVGDVNCPPFRMTLVPDRVSPFFVFVLLITPIQHLGLSTSTDWQPKKILVWVREQHINI